MTEDTPISYAAAGRGTPVLSSAGTQIGTSSTCSLEDTQAAQLPPPQGSPVYRVDALADSGHSLHDVLGRLFRRPHWIREDDQG